MTNQKGEAYAFFNCNAGYDEIIKELPRARRLAETPSALELSLFDGVDKLEGKDPRLDEVVSGAKYNGLRYSMKASLGGATDKLVADELTAILRNVYQSELYQKGETGNRAIVYQEKGEYIFRE